MADRHDPFGEFNHVTPVPVDQATQELKEVDLQLNKLAVIKQYLKAQLSDLAGKTDELLNKQREKEYQLLLSARTLQDK